MSNNIKRTKIKPLTIILVTYVILFSGWWSYLLFRQNEELFEAKIELLENQLQTEDASYNLNIKQTPEYQALIANQEGQQNMIILEGIVFFIILMIGLFLVYRSFRKEIRLANQQRNFLLSITHELKSPIASIRLILDTFIRRNLKQDQIQRFAKNGVKEATRLLRLVNNILLAARLESGFHLTKGDVDMKELVRDLIDQLQDKHPDTLFSLQMDKDIPNIQADTVALTSIALNLMENAVKYSPSETHIDVVLKHKAGNIVFEVADEGTGIPDEEKEKVFEKFYRVGNEDTRTTKGTGLGLFLVMSLLKEHNGSISVRDNHPQGAVFSVILPVDGSRKTMNRIKKAAMF